MKKFLFVALLMAGCQSKNEQQSKVTINEKEYTDSVAVDSAGNEVKVKSGAGKTDVSVSGSGNKVEIK
jgi:hypothetical protein